MRALLVDLPIPRVFLHPPGCAPAGAAGLRAAGVRFAEIPRTGHNIMLDNPQGFAEAVAAFPGPPPG